MISALKHRTVTIIKNPSPLFLNEHPAAYCGWDGQETWDGKYDEYGARRPVDIAGSAMPMQKIDTVFSLGAARSRLPAVKEAQVSIPGGFSRRISRRCS
ncbi:MAG: hypothetical protein WBL92_10540 [Methanothrix sp.]